MVLKLDKLNIEIIECKSFKQRLIGFMFKKKKIAYGLMFKNCSSVHTLFMFQGIDIISTDKDNNIIYMYENVKSGRLIGPKKGVKNIYELPLGSISKIKTTSKV